jgi:hypothetical protein
MVAVLAELPYQILRALLRQVLEQLRLPGRSSDGGFEVDIVSFPSSDAFENYLGDPHTQRHLRLLPRHLAGKEESKIRPTLYLPRCWSACGANPCNVLTLQTRVPRRRWAALRPGERRREGCARAKDEAAGGPLGEPGSARTQRAQPQGLTVWGSRTCVLPLYAQSPGFGERQWTGQRLTNRVGGTCGATPSADARLVGAHPRTRRVDIRGEVGRVPRDRLDAATPRAQSPPSRRSSRVQPCQAGLDCERNALARPFGPGEEDPRQFLCQWIVSCPLATNSGGKAATPPGTKGTPITVSCSVPTPGPPSVTFTEKVTSAFWVRPSPPVKL